jgi:hypothetical protein
VRLTCRITRHAFSRLAYHLHCSNAWNTAMAVLHELALFIIQSQLPSIDHVLFCFLKGSFALVLGIRFSQYPRKSISLVKSHLRWRKKPE